METNNSVKHMLLISYANLYQCNQGPVVSRRKGLVQLRQFRYRVALDVSAQKYERDFTNPSKSHAFIGSVALNLHLTLSECRRPTVSPFSRREFYHFLPSPESFAADSLSKSPCVQAGRDGLEHSLCFDVSRFGRLLVEQVVFLLPTFVSF